MIPLKSRSSVKTPIKIYDQKTPIERMLMEADQLCLSEGEISRLRLASRLERSRCRRDRTEAVSLYNQINADLTGNRVREINAYTKRKRIEVGQLATGAGRLRDHDGLQFLYEQKRISQRQYGAAMIYRRAVEAEGHLKSSLDAGTGTTSGGVEIRDGSGTVIQIDAHCVRGMKRARQGLIADAIERRVRFDLRARPTALILLQQVAGLGSAIREFANGGRQFKAAITDLQAALDIADQVIGLHSAA